MSSEDKSTREAASGFFADLRAYKASLRMAKGIGGQTNEELREECYRGVLAGKLYQDLDARTRAFRIHCLLKAIDEVLLDEPAEETLLERLDRLEQRAGEDPDFRERFERHLKDMWERYDRGELDSC